MPPVRTPHRWRSWQAKSSLLPYRQRLAPPVVHPKTRPDLIQYLTAITVPNSIGAGLFIDDLGRVGEYLGRKTGAGPAFGVGFTGRGRIGAG